MRNRDDDPVCVQCGSTASDGVNDEGICDYCLESPKQRSTRRQAEHWDAFESGRPMGDSDR